MTGENMNPCPKYEKSLILYSYHELKGKKVITLQKHLSQCERCRGYLDELNRVSQIIERHHLPYYELFLDIQ
ncbi:MAG: hypothetical protein ACPL6D_14335 [Thermodesulfobacteriota bacterium]